MGLGLDGLDVELGQLVALFCPLGGQIAVLNISQLHDISALLLLFVQTVQQVPDAQHILDAQRTVILAVAGAQLPGPSSHS